MGSKPKLNVHIFVTPVCNLSCKHCYYCSWPIDQTPDKLISISEICSIIINLSQDYDPDFEIEGGELFLREDIRELFENIPVKYLKNITITTNGTQVIKVSNDRLIQLNDIRISVEGHTDELQHEIRGISLDPIWKTCLTLKASQIPFTLRITLHKKNIRYFKEMVDFFIAHGYSSFSFFEFQSVGRGKLYYPEYGLSTADIEFLLETLRYCPDLHKISSFKFSFNSSRINLVNKYHDQLINSGYDVINVSNVPSLTINFDGSIGICPWNVGQERIGLFTKDLDLNTFVKGRINCRDLFHKCKNCSAIRILYRNNI